MYEYFSVCLSTTFFTYFFLVTRVNLLKEMFIKILIIWTKLIRFKKKIEEKGYKSYVSFAWK